MKKISVSKFKATCLHEVAEVGRTGESLLITKHGKPIAKLVSPDAPEFVAEKRPKYGCMADTVVSYGDLISPVSEDEWDVHK